MKFVSYRCSHCEGKGTVQIPLDEDLESWTERPCRQCGGKGARCKMVVKDDYGSEWARDINLLSHEEFTRKYGTA